MQASFLRSVRKIHRYTGIFLFAFFFIIAITGLLLGWKKNSFGLILPASSTGTSTQLGEWKSTEMLNHLLRRKKSEMRVWFWLLVPRRGENEEEEKEEEEKEAMEVGGQAASAWI